VRPYKIGRILYLIFAKAGVCIGYLLSILPAQTRIFAMSSARLIRRLDYSKKRILIAVNSDIELRIRLHSCAKEPETVAWLEELKHNDVYYDIGANIGAYVLLAAVGLKKQVRVYAFEPGPATYARLCENVLLNNCADTVYTLPLALSDTTAINPFELSNIDPGSALHVLHSDSAEGNNSGIVHNIAAARLDDLRKFFNLPQPSRIKIDVDGSELRVLKGATSTLESVELQSVLVECNPLNTTAIENFLANLGLMISTRHKQNTTNDENIIFRRKLS
jgi:FkbM family methyltransferase